MSIFKWKVYIHISWDDSYVISTFPVGTHHTLHFFWNQYKVWNWGNALNLVQTLQTVPVPDQFLRSEGLLRRAENAHIYRRLAARYLLVPQPLWSCVKMQKKHWVSEHCFVFVAGGGNKAEKREQSVSFPVLSLQSRVLSYKCRAFFETSFNWEVW